MPCSWPCSDREEQPTVRYGLWAVLVDVACLGILLWIGSGLLMWWRLAKLRAWGAIAVSGGILSFLLLVWRLSAEWTATGG